MILPRIREVKYEEGYRMSILLQNGKIINYNMQPKLVTARFKDLEEIEVFYSGRVIGAGRIIQWNENTEISIEEIILQIENTRKGPRKK